MPSARRAKAAGKAASLAGRRMRAAISAWRWTAGSPFPVAVSKSSAPFYVAGCKAAVRRVACAAGGQDRAGARFLHTHDLGRRRRARAATALRARPRRRTQAGTGRARRLAHAERPGNAGRQAGRAPARAISTNPSAAPLDRPGACTDKARWMCRASKRCLKQTPMAWRRRLGATGGRARGRRRTTATT